jgi:hypothetical protein
MIFSCWSIEFAVLLAQVVLVMALAEKVKDDYH